MRTLFWFVFLLLCGNGEYLNNMLLHWTNDNAMYAALIITVLGLLCFFQDLKELFIRR
jgi:hypothetical protein